MIILILNMNTNNTNVGLLSNQENSKYTPVSSEEIIDYP